MRSIGARAPRRFGLAVFSVFLLVSRGRLEAYGPAEEILTVGTSSVSAISSGSGSIYFEDGYFQSDAAILYAPLHLPAGAEITRICLYGYEDAGSSSFVQVDLIAVKLAPAGQSYGTTELPGTHVLMDLDLGHAVVCSDPFSYVHRETADIDGDGAPEHLEHRLRFGVSHGRLGGAGISWRRQTSPAPATATFADVPTTHPFFRAVEALAASGITSGCGPGHFCPIQNVTRGEMAAFLSRALGLYWPY